MIDTTIQQLVERLVVQRNALGNLIDAAKACCALGCFDSPPTAPAKERPARKVNAVKPKGKPVQVAPPRTRGRMKDDDILACIKGSTGLTATEIGAKFGVPPGNVMYRIDRLIAAGNLVRGGDKKYRIAVAQN